MPLYEYLCNNCNTQFELRRAMKESDAPTACPECQSDRVERQLSRVLAMAPGGANASESSSGCGCGACACATRSG